MSGINEGKRRRKHREMNFIRNDASIVNSFSHFLIGSSGKSVKPHWLKHRQFHSWELNLKACINLNCHLVQKVLIFTDSKRLIRCVATWTPRAFAQKTGSVSGTPSSFFHSGRLSCKKLKWKTLKSGVSPCILLLQPLLQKLHVISHKLKFYLSYWW